MIFSGIRFVLSSKMSLPVLSCAQQLGISLYSPHQSVGNISTVFPDQQGFAACGTGAFSGVWHASAAAGLSQDGYRPVPAR